ncbi:MAG: Hpt domain-containing protein [Bdellovibrionaceae bacterium]|nr:Hpt domain-containing protein [Bdellovibrio sp.]
MAVLPVIDHQVLKTLKDYSSPDEDLIKILLTDYKSTYSQVVTQLTIDFKNKNLTAFSDQAHALKSISSALGMARVQSLCESLEETTSFTDVMPAQLQQLPFLICEALDELSLLKPS